MTQERREGALQVVEARRAHELVRPTPDLRGRAVAEEEVVRHHLAGVHARERRNPLGKGALAQGTGRDERQEVDLVVVGKALVGVTLLVDGHVGDERHRSVGSHEPALQAAVGSADHHPAGKAERAVHPGGVEHAAVALHVEPQRALGALELGDLLDLEGG